MQMKKIVQVGTIGGLILAVAIFMLFYRPVLHEIICFKLSNPQSITHRIIDITDEGFVTKGDANEDPDSFVVQKKNIIGKVVFTIPYVGYLNHFVKTPLGFTLFIILPATIIIAEEIRNIINHRKHKNTSPTRRKK